MHGEYKVHGGKLVVADLDVKDGVMTNIQIAGDFFLEPADALEDICASLEGLPADASVEQIVNAINAKLDSDVALIGFTPESVAIAIRRALGVAKTWRDYEWQIIDSEAVPPAMHLALDDVLAQEVAAGRRAPTLRFWEWDRAAIIVGKFQSIKNEIDLEATKELGVEVIRRVTGGGAMFVEKGTAITYSLYAPTELVADMSFADSYAFLDNWVLKALNEIGIDAFYKPLNDISSTKGKIGGAAQKRYQKSTVLHHVTMAYDMDASKMMQVLRIGREKLSDKGTASAAKRVDPVKSQTGMERRAVIDHMKKTFIDLNGGTEGRITAEEYAAAEKLVKEKFAKDEWLFQIP
nr:lipoate protein ligase C-terminal domain-containing protein [uncultured Cohaesibacter sp.]